MNYSIKDIVQNELCTGCGLCVSESKSGSMVWDENGFLIPDIKAEFNENAIKLCPFNPSPDEEVKDEDKLAEHFFKDAKNTDNQVGNYFNTYVGYSKEYRETSSSGGIATFVFEQLLERGIVDHLYIVKEVEGTYEYQLFSEISEIKKISKTRYIPVTLAELFKQIDKIEGKVALSGVACFIKAVRLKQYYNPHLKEKIPFLVGIICGGLKSRFFTDYLVSTVGIAGKYTKQDYRLKNDKSTASDYSFGAYKLENLGEMKVTRMQVLGDMWGSGLFKSNACDFCTDVTTELADISLGDAWLEPYSNDGLGNSVIVTRSLLAERLILEGIKSKALDVEELLFERFLASQQGSFNHRHKGIKYRYNKVKKNKVIPHVRTRFFQNISLDFKLVQKKRMYIRKKSFNVWLETNCSEKFTAKMNADRERLRMISVFNHRVKKVKTILGI